MNDALLFHVKHLFVAIILTVHFSTAAAQATLFLDDKPFLYKFEKDSIIWRELASNNDFQQLEKEEKEFFYWVNVFRSNPKWFYEQPVVSFLNQFPEANTAEAKSLRDDLFSARPMPKFIPDYRLMAAAKAHALDLSVSGQISHISSSGKGFQERIGLVGNFTCAAENIYSGSVNGLEALILLLIDHGVPGLGHRKNLLNPSLQRMGVSFKGLERKIGVLVQIMACM